MLTIDYYLPPVELTNCELVKDYPEWTEEKILSKTGISSRHVVADGETALDLATKAAQKLDLSGVDFLLLCTQSAEYRLPSSACLLAEKLGLPKTIGALSFDHGCSGFIYGLSVAKGLIVGGMAKKVLFVTAETYTKYISVEDKSTRTIFGDGAAATLIDGRDVEAIGAFSFGTDGSGAEKLIVRNGRLVMDGPEIFNFTLDVVPKTINDVCAKNGLAREQVDFYVFHQANKFMLDTIRKVNGLPKDRFYVDLEDTGNTVSSTIPIALKRAQNNGKISANMKVMVMGFGVGLSWGGTILQY